MNKKLIFSSLSFILIGTVILTGCYNDKEELLYPSSSVVKDCSNPAITKGPKFTQVQSIINASCTSCHSVSGGTSPDLSTACQIVDKWDRIKQRCVVDQDMPTSAPLSSTDQAAITTWVDAGHKYTD